MPGSWLYLLFLWAGRFCFVPSLSSSSQENHKLQSCTLVVFCPCHTGTGNRPCGAKWEWQGYIPTLLGKITLPSIRVPYIASAVLQPSFCFQGTVPCTWECSEQKIQLCQLQHQPPLERRAVRRCFWMWESDDNQDSSLWQGCCQCQCLCPFHIHRNHQSAQEFSLCCGVEWS